MTRHTTSTARAFGNTALAVAALILALDQLTVGGHDWVNTAAISLAVLGTGLRIEAAIDDHHTPCPGSRQRESGQLVLRLKSTLLFPVNSRCLVEALSGWVPVKDAWRHRGSGSECPDYRASPECC
ncbi:hypothetical protein SAZ11_02905 [Streptomyces sp. FXJ1.4098]|nr:hypothetical protein [Streptomyces sp. FXJ1.4098]